MRKNILSIALILVTLTAFGQDVPANPTDISPLLIGEKIPDINVLTIDGKTVKMTEVLKQKPTVLIFYRGGWCPYCNAHLAQLQAAESEILKQGYQIIAVSPDAPENLSASVEKHALTYTLLSDVKSELITAIGLAFKAPDYYLKTLEKSSGGQNKGIIPVPAVFILNTDGEILFEYINPDFKKRLSSELLLSVINGL